MSREGKRAAHRAGCAAWMRIHNRITAGHAPRSYTLDQHRAFLLRKRTEP